MDFFTAVVFLLHADAGYQYLNSLLCFFSRIEGIAHMGEN